MSVVLFASAAAFVAGVVLSKLYFASVQSDLSKILACALGDVAKAQATASADLAKILALPSKANDDIKAEAEAVAKKL